MLAIISLQIIVAWMLRVFHIPSPRVLIDTNSGRNAATFPQLRISELASVSFVPGQRVLLRSRGTPKSRMLFGWLSKRNGHDVCLEGSIWGAIRLPNGLLEK